MLGVNQVIGAGTSVAKEAGTTAGRVARFAGGVAQGVAHRVMGGARPKEGMDDATLQHKVESIVFRPKDAPKGSVDINVVDGVVYLRGEVRHPEDVKALEQAVRAIPEVQGVENLLHLPKTPAPTRTDTPPSQRKSRRTAPRSANPRTKKPAGGAQT